ncbi:uncharacterized protein JCM15063_005149 [Sporobolomyces koalae]|uniref:uncharacterized protein n=1 Tax=Sporobolomyces koalae TaxID=500713 RepID=UPI00316E78D7
MGAESPQLPTATTSSTSAQYTALSSSGNSHLRHPSHARGAAGGTGGRAKRGSLARCKAASGALLKRPAGYLSLIGLVVGSLVLYNTTRREAEQRGDESASRDRKETGGGYFGDSFERLSKGWTTSLRRPASNDDGEWACNPFEANGRLAVDLETVTNTQWVPYDSRCRPSNLLKDLYRPPGDTLPLIPDASSATPNPRSFLPWFRNRTVLLHGDSIDRFHLKDFCEFVGGKLELITPEHRASPPMWKRPGADSARKAREAQWEQRPPEGWELTNPWVCDIAEYGTTLINVFTWGLQGAEEFFEMERWYYPPATWTDRMDHITLPLLPRLAKYLDRPQIEHPDLVILNSGYWDLRKYTEEDFVAAGFPNRPYPEDSPIPYTPLSAAREQTWEREARKAMQHAATSFKGKDGKAKNGPTLLWRSLHHPPRHNYAPFPRVFQLDSLARKVVSDLRLSQTTSSSSLTRSPSPALSQTTSQESTALSEGEDLGLNHRLRIDESGKLMLGQEHLFRDLLHPLPVPGSWIWADIMLYELKRATEGVDR